MDKVLAQSIAETCLLAHMLFLMVEECEKNGYTFRADVKHKLNVASASPMARLSPHEVILVAQETDKIARSLLHDLSPDDPRHGLYVCAMFNLLVVDEGLFLDLQNVAITTAMLLVDDVKTEDDTSHFTFREARLKHDAKKMLRRAQILGYFMPTNAVTTLKLTTEPEKKAF